MWIIDFVDKICSDNNPLSKYNPEDIITNIPNIPHTFKRKIIISENKEEKLTFKTIDINAEKLKAKKLYSKNRLSTEQIRENIENKKNISNEKKNSVKCVKPVQNKKIINTNNVNIVNNIKKENKKISYLLFEQEKY